VADDISKLTQLGYSGQYASDISAGRNADATALKDANAGASAAIQGEAGAIQTATDNCT